jgi:hypothetical protein
MATFLNQLTPLVGKPVSVAIVGVHGSEAYSGVLASVGDDYIELDGGPGDAHTWIPATAIASVVATP